jgi:hypothetical protein
MLTLQFIPYHEIENMSSENKIRKLLNLVRSDKILLVEGRLNPIEEATLIERTMEQISRDFKGIEICTVLPDKKNQAFSKKLRSTVLKMFGYKEGLTIIGPATIIKEITRDPNKIELLTTNKRKR